MAVAPPPFRGRLLALQALLLACGIGFLTMFAWQVAQLVERPVVETQAAPQVDRAYAEYHRAIAYEKERLPPLFPDDTAEIGRAHV